MLLALSLPLLSAGKSRPARMAMIAMTTSNSIKVKASFLLESRGTNREISRILAPAKAQLFTDRCFKLAVIGFHRLQFTLRQLFLSCPDPQLSSVFLCGRLT